MQYNRLDVFYVDLKPSVGSVQGGTRPCVLVGNHLSLKHSDAIQVVPLTTKLNKSRLPTHLNIKEDFLTNESVCLFEQVMTISKKQLRERLGKLDDTYTDLVNSKLAISLAIDPAYA